MVYFLLQMQEIASLILVTSQKIFFFGFGWLVWSGPRLQMGQSRPVSWFGKSILARLLAQMGCTGKQAQLHKGCRTRVQLKNGLRIEQKLERSKLTHPMPIPDWSPCGFTESNLICTSRSKEAMAMISIFKFTFKIFSTPISKSHLQVLQSFSNYGGQTVTCRL